MTARVTFLEDNHICEALMPGPITDALPILSNLTLRSLGKKAKAQRLQAPRHTASWRQPHNPGRTNCKPFALPTMINCRGCGWRSYK